MTPISWERRFNRWSDSTDAGMIAAQLRWASKRIWILQIDLGLNSAHNDPNLKISGTIIRFFLPARVTMGKCLLLLGFNAWRKWVFPFSCYYSPREERWAAREEPLTARVSRQQQRGANDVGSWTIVMLISPGTSSFMLLLLLSSLYPSSLVGFKL